MNQKKIEQLAEEIKIELAKDLSDYRFFKTKPGMKFQEDFKDLMTFTSYNNVVPKIMGSLSSFNDLIKKILEKNVKNKHKVKFQLFENESLIKELIYDKDGIINFFQNLNDESNLFKERESEITRLNACYFLSFFSYIDHYSTELYRTIISRYCADHSFKLFDSGRPKSRPKELIDRIKKELELDTSSILTKVPKGKPWYTNYIALFKIRHKFAHNEPDARREILEKFFSETTDEAKDTIETIFKKSRAEKNQDKDFLDTIEINLKPSFETLYTLTKIGKDCYGYLALIDNLIDEYFTTNR